MTVAEHNK